MKAPLFWHNPPSKWSAQGMLLAPLSCLYASMTARRVAKAPLYTAPVPVICVGNLNAGGVGKTPTVIAVAEHFKQAGHAVHILSKGYGGSVASTKRVDPRSNTADEVGDEPLLLSAFAPVWVSPSRVDAAKAAVAAGADMLILDDGFQDPALAKSLSIVVVDAAVGFGNGRVIPSGPLREPVKAGLLRADLVLSIGAIEAQSQFQTLWGDVVDIPQLQGDLFPLQTGMDWQGMRALAFAGIGRPEKFFKTLKDLGAELVEEVPLGDHQPLSLGLLKRLEARAKELNAQLMTTEKDACRLPASFKSKVLTCPVRLQVDLSPVAEAIRFSC